MWINYSLTATSKLDVSGSDTSIAPGEEEMSWWRWLWWHSTWLWLHIAIATAAAAAWYLVFRSRPLRRRRHVFHLHDSRCRCWQFGGRRLWTRRCRRSYGSNSGRRFLDALDHHFLHRSGGRLHRSSVTLGQCAQLIDSWLVISGTQHHAVAV